MNHMITQRIDVELHDNPAEAPKYPPSFTMIKITKAVVIGRNTQGGKPTVDIQCEDANGKQFVIMVTGALVEMLGGSATGMRTRTGG